MSQLTDRDLEQMYCEMLDDCYGEVIIAGYTYQTSRALAEIDPTAFRCGLSDYIDSLLGETIEEIDGEYFEIS